MLCTQNIIIDKVRHTVAEVRIGIYYQLFFCVLLVPQTRFWDKKHCTVCKNSLHCLRANVSHIT